MTRAATMADPRVRVEETRDLGPVPAFVAHFRRFEEQQGAGCRSSLHDVRTGAIERFQTLGFPTTKHEEWRFTNVAPIAKQAWKPAAPGAEGCEDCARAIRADLAAHFFGDWPGARVTLVNGRVSRALSSAGGLPAGVFVGGLADALRDRPALVEPHLARHARFDDHGLVALNTAFIEDGAFVHVPRGTVVERPIVIVHATFAPEPTVVQPRTLIVAEERSDVHVVELHCAPAGQVYFANAVTEIVQASDAIVEHVKLEAESVAAYHVASIHARCERASNFANRNVSYGGGLVRNDITAVFAGEGCDYQLDGLYILSDRQHVDNHTVVDHAAPHCGGRETYRGILDGRSVGIFNGRIIVRPGAQKTDAKQTNKNLLLSDEAQVETKPQLEIYANDVKCTHGATVGRLDEESLFYLRSRGLPAGVARGLLTYGFASELVGRVKVEPVRAELERLFFRRFGGEGVPG